MVACKSLTARTSCTTVLTEANKPTGQESIDCTCTAARPPSKSIPNPDQDKASPHAKEPMKSQWLQACQASGSVRFVSQISERPLSSADCASVLFEGAAMSWILQRLWIADFLSVFRRPQHALRVGFTASAKRLPFHPACWRSSPRKKQRLGCRILRPSTGIAGIHVFGQHALCVGSTGCIGSSTVVSSAFHPCHPAT